MEKRKLESQDAMTPGMSKKIKYEIEKPFECTYPGCNYKCSTKSNLLIHCNRHAGIRYVEKHKRIRTKLYYCDTCEYKTFYSTHLTAHKATHSTERPFKCEKCEYTSKTMNQLNRHKLYHSDKKKHNCDFLDCGLRIT